MNKKIILSLALAITWPSLHAMNPKKLIVGALLATSGFTQMAQNQTSCELLVQDGLVTCNVYQFSIQALMNCNSQCTDSACIDRQYAMFLNAATGQKTKVIENLNAHNCPEPDAKTVSSCFREALATQETVETAWFLNCESPNYATPTKWGFWLGLGLPSVILIRYFCNEKARERFALSPGMMYPYKPEIGKDTPYNTEEGRACTIIIIKDKLKDS